MRMFRTFGAVQLVVFLVIAIVLAFVIAVMLLMWLWQKITGTGRSTNNDLYDDRTPDGRRRY